MRTHTQLTVYANEPSTRGKVVLHTSLGPLDVELWSKEARRLTPSATSITSARPQRAPPTLASASSERATTAAARPHATPPSAPKRQQSGSLLSVARASGAEPRASRRRAQAPLACRNFVQLGMEGYYDGCIFHRVIKDFTRRSPTRTGPCTANAVGLLP